MEMKKKLKLFELNEVCCQAFTLLFLRTDSKIESISRVAAVCATKSIITNIAKRGSNFSEIEVYHQNDPKNKFVSKLMWVTQQIGARWSTQKWFPKELNEKWKKNEIKYTFAQKMCKSRGLLDSFSSSTSSLDDSRLNCLGYPLHTNETE